MKEFMEGYLGIKIATEKLMRIQWTKVNISLNEAYEEWTIENRMEHMKEFQALDNYGEDLSWVKDGVAHLTSWGKISRGGTGYTRVYNHQHRGRQSAFIANSRNTSKSLALLVSLGRPCLLFHFTLHV